MFANNTQQSFKKYFAPITGNPNVTGAQTTALKSVSEHFISIGTILAEGGVPVELIDMVGNQLLAAKLAADSAIVTGWAGGSKGY